MFSPKLTDVFLEFNRYGFGSVFDLKRSQTKTKMQTEIKDELDFAADKAKMLQLN